MKIAERLESSTVITSIALQTDMENHSAGEDEKFNGNESHIRDWN
jgi:hypothetical protein